MAKWKIVTSMAIAKREQDRLLEEKRQQEEQRLEVKRNMRILRSLRRDRDRLEQRGKLNASIKQSWSTKFVREVQDARLNVGVSSSTVYQKLDKKNQDDIISKIQLLEGYKAKVRKVEAALDLIHLREKETDKEIRDTRVRLRDWRSGKGHTHPKPRITNPNNMKMRSQVEHEKLGLQLAENARLSQLIQHLQGQRDMVTLFHTQLKKELDGMSKDLSGHLEKAQSVYEQRDLNQRNMDKLTEHMTKSQTGHMNDMQNLQFKIDVCKRMEEFMMAKNKFRMDTGRKRRKESRMQVTQIEKEVILLRELLEKLQCDLNESDTRVIVNTFFQLQTENYMLFKNISHVRDGCHRLQSQLGAMKEKAERTKVLVQKERKENKMRKEELVEKIEHCRELARATEVEEVVADKVINTYIQAISLILERMHYTPAAITSLAGVYKQIEARNINVFLSEIEAYVNRLHRLHMTREYYNWLETKKTSFTNIPAESMPPREQPSPRVVVLPPQLPDWNIAEEDEDHELPRLSSIVAPINVDELRSHMEDELVMSGYNTPTSELETGRPSRKTTLLFQPCV